MIQRYTCIPTFEYDVIILTNGSVQQVENKLNDIEQQLPDSLPECYKTTYFNSFRELVDYLNTYKENKYHPLEFNGKIFFMFFNGLSFIQDVLSDAIDYHQSCVMKKTNRQYELMCKMELRFPSQLAQSPFDKLNNCYFYFDSSIFDMEDVDFENSFNYFITIISDVLKKVNFMVGNIKGIIIDDLELNGDKIFPVHCLLRNYPRIERIELSSDISMPMKEAKT